MSWLGIFEPLPLQVWRTLERSPDPVNVKDLAVSFGISFLAAILVAIQLVDDPLPAVRAIPEDGFFGFVVLNLMHDIDPLVNWLKFLPWVKVGTDAGLAGLAGMAMASRIFEKRRKAVVKR